MKKIVLYIWIVLMAWLVPGACIDDKTSGFKTDGSPIVISVQDTVVYQDFGFPLVIEPEITQLLSDLPLKYEWRWMAMDGGEGSDSLRFISGEKVFEHKFSRAGVFKIRLRVENQYGSSFKYFTANIRAPFEQGLLILSNDEEDNGRLSFVRLKEENELLDKENTDFNSNAFGQANPEIILRGARDVIFARTGKDYPYSYVLAISSEPEQKIYFLNGRYFLMENIVDVKKFYPEAYPTVLCGNGDNAARKMMFGTNDRMGHPGDCGFVHMESFLAYPGETFGEYDKIIVGECKDEDWGLTTYLGWFIDNTHSNVWGIEYGNSTFTSGERFTGKQVINGAYIDKSGKIVLVAVEKGNPRKVSIHKSDFNSWDWDTREIVFESDPYIYTVDGDLNLTADSRMVSNGKYQYIYYYQGNKIYRWVYMAQEPELPTKPELILDDPDDEITCMEMSPNREHLWVCVYNKTADTELKGKLLIVNPATMAVEKTIKGISDRAIKVMWKPVEFNEK